MKLFPNVRSEELKSVTLSLPSDVHQIAEQNADALRISKRRWLELLIENTVNEHGGNHGGSKDDTQSDVSDAGLGTNRIHSQDEGYIAQDFIRSEIMKVVSDAESDALAAPIGGGNRTSWQFNFARVSQNGYQAGWDQVE